jgi:hypothetical protein
VRTLFSVASIDAMTWAMVASDCWKPSLSAGVDVFAATVAMRASIGSPRATTRSAAVSAYS